MGRFLTCMASPDDNNHPFPSAPTSAARADARSADAGAAEAQRLSLLLRDIQEMLEGSVRSVEQVRTRITADTVVETLNVAAVEKQLRLAAENLERLAGLVHAAMQSPAHALGSPMLNRARPITLGEAALHAVDVVRPLAERHGVRVTTALAPAAHAVPAGALYTVMLNGVQNAVESIARRGGVGAVEMALKHDAPPSTSYGRDTREWYVLTITDDGEGAPKNTDSARFFDLGFTTKKHGTGVGLAVAKSVVQGMGGSIRLEPNAAGGGCVLTVHFPAPAAAGSMRLGA